MLGSTVAGIFETMEIAVGSGVNWKGARLIGVCAMGGFAIRR